MKQRDVFGEKKTYILGVNLRTINSPFSVVRFALIARENRRLSQYNDRSGDSYTLFRKTDCFVGCSPRKFVDL